MTKKEKAMNKVLPQGALALRLHLNRVGRSESTIHNYELSIRHLQEFCLKHRTRRHDPMVSKAFRVVTEKACKAGQIGWNTYRYRVRASIFIDNHYEGRLITVLPSRVKSELEGLKPLPSRPMARNLSPAFKAELEDYSKALSHILS